MKTLNHYLPLVLVLMIIAAGCRTNHKKHHTILSLPYEANKGYFIKQCYEDSITSKCRWNPSCFAIKNLHYVPFYCGTSKRKFVDPMSYTGNLDSFYIYVPLHAINPIITNLTLGANPNVTIAQSNSNVNGSLGCNYFLTDEDTNSISNVADDTLTNQTSKKRGCSLDYFTIGDYRYINLLFVDHKDHDSLGNVLIKKFDNMDFCISIADYNRLNSLIQQHGSQNVLGGIDIENRNVLKIFVNDTFKFNITSALPINYVYNPINPEYILNN